MLIERLINRLQLTASGDDVFIGGAGAGSATVGDRLFGGMVAAQAATAASRTVTGKPLHALHALFLRPGRADVDIRYDVQRIKNGRNFHARLVSAYQDDELVFQCQASFAAAESGVEHQDQAPDAPDPETCPNRDELRGREQWRDLPIDVRMCDPITDQTPRPAQQRVWLRANGTIPDDPALHQSMMIYASDRSLLDTAWRPHADHGLLAAASLDHTIWFHAPVQFDDWHLYTMNSPAAAAGRGLVLGAIHNRAGKRIASVAQEGVLRTA